MNNISGFDVPAFINELVVTEDNEDYIHARKRVEITLLMYPNAYLARADLYGTITSMENYISYTGGTLVPAKQQRIKQLSGRGFMAEDDLRQYKFANESMPHINEERSVDDVIADIRAELDQLIYSMQVAAIMMVVCIREHDELSNQLGLHTFSAIKAKAAQNKMRKSGGPNVKAINF